MENRNSTIDLLKLILAVMVVLLHCSFLKEYSDRIAYLFSNGVFRIAVPLFFTINGYFFEPIVKNDLLYNWLKRAVLLYLIWMLLYSPLWFDFNLNIFLSNLVFGYHHLWYINAMILCGIALWFLKTINSKLLFFIALLLFICGVVIQYMGNYHVFSENSLYDKLSNMLVIHRSFLFLGLPFFIIGYLIKTNPSNRWIISKASSYVLILGLVLLLVESNFNFIFTSTGFDNLFALLLICPSLFIFVLRRKIYFETSTSKKLALLSTAMYLIHPLLIDFIRLPFTTPTLGTLVIVILTVIVSSFIVELNKKLKILL